MIHLRKDYGITCNKCHKPLKHTEDSIMIAHRGCPIYEDTRENIKKVAKDKGWDIEKEYCEKCNTIMKEALKWWNSLPEEMKAKFPTPVSDEDILAYYEDPAENMQLEYGML